MVIAKKIKELRAEKGLSQAQLAKKIGCSQSMIVRWEKCECEPTASNIVKLAAAFDCSTDYLLGVSEY